MKTLIFTAQPSSTGFVHTIASQYAGTKNNTETTAEIVNLYDEQYQLPFLDFENMRDIEMPENAKKLQKKNYRSRRISFYFSTVVGKHASNFKKLF